MARGSKEAQGGAKLGLQTATTGYGTVLPELQRDVTAPAGFSEPDLAKMNTVVQQSGGGANAGAVGQGALLAGRTKNPGMAAGAVAQSARNTGEEASQNALGIRVKDAELKQQKRQAALGQLGQVSGQALGQISPNVQADAAQKEASWGWAKNIFGPIMGAAGGAATGYMGRR